MSDSKIFVVTTVTGGGEDGRGQYHTTRIPFADRVAANAVCTSFNVEGGRSTVIEEPIFNTMLDYLTSLPDEVCLPKKAWDSLEDARAFFKREEKKMAALDEAERRNYKTFHK